MKWMLAAAAAGVLSSFLFAGAPKPANTIAPASWFTENVPAANVPAGKAASPAGGEARPELTPSPGQGEASATMPPA